MSSKEDESSKMAGERKQSYGAVDAITSGLKAGVGTVASGVKGGVGTVASGVGTVASGVKGGVGTVADGVGSVAKGVGGLAARGIGAGAGMLDQSYGKALGGYDKLFLKHKNKDFGDHLEVASRGACFVVLCAIPFVTPHEICPTCHDIVAKGYFSAGCVTYFIYTLYLYTGDIIHFAQGGIMGTILAVVNIWLMQGFMPGGYVEGMDHRWYIGSVWGILFTFLVLWLNFDDNTKIFGLSTYVWYWMSFLQPNSTAGFSQNFEINFNGKAVLEFGVAVIGCGIAVLAAYIPYPIYAHTRAMDIATKMVTQIYMTKRDFIGYYSGGEEDPMAIEILHREIGTLQDEVGAIGGLLDTAWYECLGTGRWQTQRVMMAKYANYTKKTIDLMSNVFEICQTETFDKSHVNIMNGIAEPLNKIINSNGEILKCCLAGLRDASFDDEIKQIVGDKKERWEEESGERKKAKDAVIDMTSKLQLARGEEGYNKVSEDAAGENVVALTFSKFTELTADFYDSLQGPQIEKLSWKDDGAGLRGIFQPSMLFEFDHIMWTLRNGLSIVISFYIGWYGYNRYIDKYNAAIASTVAVLLSKFVGSAMVKNLARLQGVVIGIVLGNLLYAFLAWCYWWGHLAVAVALYCWTLLGLFMYFHSTNYSTVGLLLAVFGSQSLLRPCANDNTDPQGLGSIVNVTVGISVMTIVDMFLSPDRASSIAQKNFRVAFMAVINAVDKLFDPECKVVEDRGGALRSAIAAAETMGNEAGLEPRYWRHEWPAHKYAQAISCLKTLRFCVDSIENIVLNANREKSKLFSKVIAMDSCGGAGGIRALIKDHATNVMEAVEKSLGDDAHNDVFMERLAEIKPDKMRARKTFGKEWKDAIDKFCKEMNGDSLGKKFSKTVAVNEKVIDVSNDPLADCSLIVESLKAMFGDLDKTLKTTVT